MSSIRVLVIGCGIAGPVLSIFLKRKGYDPVLFDRLDGVQEAGISLMLQPNGLKVLSLVPGLIERVQHTTVGLPIDKLGFYSLVSSPPSTLGTVDDVSSGFTERYGHGMFGVRRTAFHGVLVDAAKAEGIEIRWGRQLQGLREVKGENGENEVIAMFTNGETERGSFAVGCDGLHSNTRVSLFGNENPTFTGVVQVGGYSPTPNILREKATMANIYNVTNHMITYPVSPTHSAWAISNAEPEAKESWRAIDDKAKEEFKSGPWSKWPLGAGDLVKHSEKIVKYGLYDRPQLKTWSKGRVVLLGDAAHPTTPHIGQGANQAFEDIYHLILALTKYHTTLSRPPSNAELTSAFAVYESVRIPRSASLVKGARERGQTRVVPDEHAAHERDNNIRQTLLAENIENMLHEYDNIAQGPFEGNSEVILA